jgi:hypothetical protein
MLNDTIIESFLAKLFEARSFHAMIVTMFLIFYGTSALPKKGKLPRTYMLIINSFVVRIFVLSLIVYKISDKYMPSKAIFSLIISSAFILIFDSSSAL